MKNPFRLNKSRKSVLVVYGGMPTIVTHVTTDKRKIRSWKRRYTGMGILGELPYHFFNDCYVWDGRGFFIFSVDENDSERNKARDRFKKIMGVGEDSSNVSR